MTNHRLNGPDLGVCNLKILDNFFGPNPAYKMIYFEFFENTLGSVYLAGLSFIPKVC